MFQVPNLSSLIRVIILLALAVFISFVVPGTRRPITPAALAPLITFFSILLAILIVRSLERIEKLNAAIALELNKARRIYHLGKNLSAERLRSWFTDLHGYIYEYFMFFDKHDFTQYEDSNKIFRKVTYHVYTLPALETAKDNALYNELLKAAADAVMARQSINELKKTSMPIYLWLVVILTALAVILSTLLVTTPDVISKIAQAALFAALFLGMDLLYELDGLKFFGKRELARRYVDNIARLELRDREMEEKKL